ncbi:hypothetical protein [Ornithinibacillus halotolerans]|uniref:Uncharacterized protein n=1 Tax=Ornithinibacillus halotolerans TaxID=1274357 RepID=A0A916WA38_9BACI|nr:hypothetical protein [Ornithinibacillus halotolerans]GGA79800.1 hypothetical protein GCM10008025_24020 [Ornithinibacillus halotolerans]
MFPDWQMIEQDIVQINDTYYTVIAIAQNAVEFEEKVKIAIIDYDSKGEENKWSTVWESEEYYADPIIDMESYIGEYYVLNPDDTSVALVVFNVMHSGTLRMYETYAIQIDESGQGEVAWAGSASYIEKKEDYIEIMVHGSVQLSIEDNEVKTTEIPRSELGSQDALQVEFTLNQDGVVIPTGDEEIYVKKDQPITLIPADETTKSLFDEGDISVYLGNMENGSIPTANAYLVYVGNEFTFTEEGTYGFLLDYYTENSSTPPYTILVHVGDGVKPEESEEEDVASSTEIIAPFAMGTPLDELFEHYGEPTYNDYYNGGWLVVFNKEGYFIDELEETVRGYFFSVPTISVFGATIGMTGEEINSIYGDSVEPYFDDISTGQYVLTFYKNGYKIFFYSEEENGPTSSMWLVEE